MKNCTKYLFKSLAITAIFTCLLSCSNDNKNEKLIEVTKVALRDVGHKLLLFNKDSISLVKPVLALNDLKFQISFEETISIHPDTLVNIIKNSFYKANLPEHYLTEVVQCEDGEVAYSYEIKQSVENAIIPCGGRQLPKACYTINVRFAKPIHRNIITNYIYPLLFLALLALAFVLYKRKNKSLVIPKNASYAEIGSYQFFPEQNKLVKKAKEISLSKKECELLEILVSNPNQIVKRDELEKRVWEDNGVIVGRSLDTYISKLRKKLQDDDSIKITNIHGVGYKLEVLKK